MPYISRFSLVRGSIDEELLFPKDVADLLSVTLETLARWREQETGPSWFQFVNEVRYSSIDLLEFIKGAMHDTSEVDTTPPWVTQPWAVANEEKPRTKYQTKARKSP